MLSEKQKNKRPEFTAESAVEFDRYSQANAALVRACLPCGCEPYMDVFTYNRWSAQGYQVRRGSKAVKAPLLREREVRDPSSGEVLRVAKIRGRSALFCRCQVDKIDDQEAPSAPEASPVRAADLFEFPASESVQRAALEEVRRG